MKVSSARKKAGLTAVGMAAVLVLVGLVGCTDEVRGPQQVFESYVDALRHGDQQRALQEVWPDTRDELEGAYDELAEYFDGQPPVERSELLLVTRAANPMSISRITVEDEVPDTPDDGETVSLMLEFRDTRTASVPVRWSQADGRWYVDLPVEQRRPLDIENDGDTAPDRQGVRESSGVRDEVNDQ